MPSRSKPHRSVGKVGWEEKAPLPTPAVAGPFALHHGRKDRGRKGLSPVESGYVTHADLLRLAMRNHCLGIRTEPVLALCRPGKDFWVFKATVFKSAQCRGFVGYGDAHPGNV